MRPGQPASSETRAKMSAAQRAPDVIERRRAAQQSYWTPERRERARQRATEESKDPARAKVRVRTAEAMADPACKARQVAGIRTALAKPEIREKISRRTREAMTDPAVRERIMQGLALAREHPDRASRAAEGIRRTFEADHIVIEHRALVDAWKAARPAARNRFLSELFGPLWGATK